MTDDKNCMVKLMFLIIMILQVQKHFEKNEEDVGLGVVLKI